MSTESAVVLIAVPPGISADLCVSHERGARAPISLGVCLFRLHVNYIVN